MDEHVVNTWTFGPGIVMASEGEASGKVRNRLEVSGFVAGVEDFADLVMWTALLAIMMAGSPAVIATVLFWRPGRPGR